MNKLSIKMNKILLFVATFMDIEGITQSEISHTDKDKYCMCNLKSK